MVLSKGRIWSCERDRDGGKSILSEYIFTSITHTLITYTLNILRGQFYTFTSTYWWYS